MTTYFVKFLTGGFTPEGFSFTADYDVANRLISLQYTDGGGSHTYTYTYNGDGFLAQINDLRIVRDGALSLQERNPAGDILREYTWGLSLGGGIGGLLSLHVPQGDAHYNYLYDGKGNVEAILDNTQAIVAQYRYDPFDNLLAQSGTLEQPFRFSTKRCDAATGLVYYGRRFYSPAMGRWTTRDPLGEHGGLNLYAFVGNNPVNWVDPYGQELAGAGLGALIGGLGGGIIGAANGTGFWKGAVSGAVGGFITGLTFNPVWGASGSAIMAGAVSGAAGGVTSGITGEMFDLVNPNEAASWKDVIDSTASGLVWGSILGPVSAYADGVTLEGTLGTGLLSGNVIIWKSIQWQELEDACSY
ncbi:YD repeat protein [Candidatus Vecturithrix granuli]|uniref:YD repeat protein n=1 Tax=Vecturithrix granuli TaxID=1499967 RepID=A0A081C0X7_VECG1|nr:YD repeat protein [Candidatus Vecturithrix granuli]